MGTRIKNLPAGVPALGDPLPFDDLGDNTTKKTTVGQILALQGEVIVRRTIIVTDASPIVIVPSLAGDWVLRCSAMIEIPWNDAASSMQVGTVAQPDLFLTTGRVDMQNIGTYDNFDIVLPGADTIQVRVVRGAATTGRCNLLIRIARS